MLRAFLAALLLCACGARTELSDLDQGDARVRSPRDASPPIPDAADPPELDADVPTCPCMGAALLVGGTESPTAIAVDRTHVYWASAGRECDDGSINRVPKCGGPVEVLAAAEPNPRAIALDEEHVYFYDGCGSGRLARVPKAGGPVRAYPISVGDSGRALAVGADEIYFSDYGLLRTPKAGGAQSVIDSSTYVYDVAADARGAYWTGPIGGVGPYGVFSYHPGDPGSTQIATTSSASNGIALDEGFVYFSGSGGISRVSREGGAITPVAPSITSWRIAVDERFVYWTVGFSGSGGYTVYRAPKTGAEEPTVLGTGDGAYVALAVDAQCVYVADLYGDEIRSFPIF